MSATLAVMLKELNPTLTIDVCEMLGDAAQESSNAWNSAGTGHAALCELNDTPRMRDGRIDISKALQVNTEFDLSRQFWAYLVRGSVSDNHFVEAESILFKDTPAHSSYDWHNDPIPQIRDHAGRCARIHHCREARHSPSVQAMCCSRPTRPAPATRGG